MTASSHVARALMRLLPQAVEIAYPEGPWPNRWDTGDFIAVWVLSRAARQSLRPIMPHGLGVRDLQNYPGPHLALDVDGHFVLVWSDESPELPWYGHHRPWPGGMRPKSAAPAVHQLIVPLPDWTHIHPPLTASSGQNEHPASPAPAPDLDAPGLDRWRDRLLLVELSELARRWTDDDATRQQLLAMLVDVFVKEHE